MALPLAAKKAFFAKLTKGKVKGGRLYNKNKAGLRDKFAGKGGGAFGSKADLDEFFGSSGGDQLSAIRPTGRAPRGRGPEWKARKSIANKIQTQQKNRAALQTRINNYRGQKRGNWEMTRIRGRVNVLNKAISDAFTIAESPGDWALKKELIDGIFEYASVTTAR